MGHGFDSRLSRDEPLGVERRRLLQRFEVELLVGRVLIHDEEVIAHAGDDEPHVDVLCSEAGLLVLFSFSFVFKCFFLFLLQRIDLLPVMDHLCMIFLIYLCFCKTDVQMRDIYEV